MTHLAVRRNEDGGGSRLFLRLAGVLVKFPASDGGQHDSLPFVAMCLLWVLLPIQASPPPPIRPQKSICMGLIQNPPARHLPAPQKKPYIYKKTSGTLGTLGTAPVSPVVIGLVGIHTQIFTWVPVGTALLFRA